MITTAAVTQIHFIARLVRLSNRKLIDISLIKVLEYYHMLDFYQKRKLRAIMNSRITQAVLVAIVCFMLWNVFERYTIASTMSDRRALIEQEAAVLQAREASLEKEVQYLRDDRGIEAEMRRQFDIALPGEEVVVILEDENATAVTPLATSTEESTSWWPW